jgi:hypothetical protein
MTLANVLPSREFDKFEDLGGLTAVRTTGSATFTGLKTGGLVTHLTLNASTWSALPTTPLLGRNSLTVQNISGNGNIVLWNYSNSAPITEGFRIEDGGFKSVAITDSVITYAKMLSGAGTIVVDEVA